MFSDQSSRDKPMKLADLPSRTIDFGHGHNLSFTVDDQGNVIGAIEGHLTPDGKLCEGYIHFDVPEFTERYGRKPGAVMWQLESWNPLTLSPSLLCTVCKNHGWIREGKWVPA
jgi:hypothetical protein